MPYNSIDATTKARRCACRNNHCGGIISHLAQTNANKEGSTAPLINNLKIIEVFKDKNKEEKASITDLIR